MDALFEQYQVPDDSRRAILDFFSCFTLAFLEGDSNKVRHKILSYREHNKGTLLHAACRVGYLRNVKFILDVGVNINICDGYERNSLHMVTIFYGDYEYSQENRVELIKFLLNSGVNYEQKDVAGKTPLDYFFEYACSKDKKEIIDYIEEMGLR